MADGYNVFICLLTGAFTMKRFHALILITILSLTACKKWGQEEDDDGPFKGMTAKQLRTESKNALKKEQYASAVKRLEAMESMHPFSNYAEEAQMDLIYAYYKNEEYPSAAASAERFTHLYPRAKRVDYAYYMKALANFQQVRGALANVLPIDESWRDTGTQTQSYADFSLLVQRFPDSAYKADSLQRMVYLRNIFAKRELNAANYYMDRKMYVATAERANYLIKNYPQASSAKAAFALLYRANVAMGLKQAAAEVSSVYEATYHGKLSAKG